jgi:hypothetical protein
MEVEISMWATWLQSDDKIQVVVYPRSARATAALRGQFLFFNL